MKTILITVCLWILILPLFAQEISTSSSLITFHVGPSWYLGKQIGITNYSDTYRDDLRSGIAWEASYHYLLKANSSSTYKFSPGLTYQGSQYKNSNEESSDKILMHYIAPQIGLFIIKKRFNFTLSTGLGWQAYTDKSTVFNKPRKVLMNKLAYNLSASGEFLICSHFGVSAKINWIASDSESYSVKYHGKKWDVNMPEKSGGGGFFSQLSALIGFRFHL